MYVEGEVVFTMGNTYHQKCFTCSRCNQPFQTGSKVSHLISFVEKYNNLRKFIFSKVTNLGEKERFCEECVAIPPNSEIQSSDSLQSSKECFKGHNSPTRAMALKHNQTYASSGDTLNDDTYDPNSCAGCKQQLKEGQALIALDRQWHINCFR